MISSQEGVCTDPVVLLARSFLGFTSFVSALYSDNFLTGGRVHQPSRVTYGELPSCVQERCAGLLLLCYCGLVHSWRLYGCCAVVVWFHSWWLYGCCDTVFCVLIAGGCMTAVLSCSGSIACMAAVLLWPGSIAGGCMAAVILCSVFS